VSPDRKPGLQGADGGYYYEMMHICRMLLTVLASVLCGACAEQEASWAPPVAFDTARVWIRAAADSAGLLVEVSRTAAQRSFGLMSRPLLDPESGMLFLYDSAQAGSSGYWMFRTKMPLDIAFMDSAGVIGKVLSMEPCQSELYAAACPTHTPGVDYWSALEVNRGWFAEHRIGEGDTVRLEP
jgi:uncharacterized membrane protein (UPF0127 family)